MTDINEDCLDQPYILFASTKRFNRQGEAVLEQGQQIYAWAETHLEEPFDTTGKGRAIRHELKVAQDIGIHSVLLPGLLTDIASNDYCTVLQVVGFEKYRCLSDPDSYDRWIKVVYYRKKIIVNPDGTVLIDDIGVTVISDNNELVIEG